MAAKEPMKIYFMPIYFLAAFTLLMAGCSNPNPSSSASALGERPLRIDRAPLRTVHEDHSYAAFYAVAVDPVRDEILLQSANRPSVQVYDRRLEYASLEPKRWIEGATAKIGSTGLYVDPKNGEIYSVATDGRDWMTVHESTANGDTPPIRELTVPHRAHAITVDEKAQEIYLSRQDASVLVYAKTAKGNDVPLRVLSGPHTQLRDVFGIAVDPENQELYVANRGDNENGYAPPSITVYPLKAEGNTPPLRVIQGARTWLNWPGLMALDTKRQELFVAESFDNAILVFRATDSGDVAPLRVLKGPSTGLSAPYGVALDEKDDRLIVANYGNYSATIYPRTAVGDAPPIRTIRSAPEGTVVPIWSHAHALAYDSKRNELIVPSCNPHWVIATFANAETGEPPTRLLGGTRSQLRRAQHEIVYDSVNDEILTNSGPNMLVFRGGFDGEERPLRVIEGSSAPEGYDIDPLHGEYFLPGPGTIRVFSRTADGKVEPIRVISGPDTGLGNEPGKLAVDPVSNLLAVAIQSPSPQILIFNRTDQGNVKPRAVITGPQTDLTVAPNLKIIPETGMLLALQVKQEGGYSNAAATRFLHMESPSTLSVWSINDNGDVPPRFVLGGPESELEGNELTFNREEKTVIVGSATLLQEYHFPEIF